MNLSDKKLRELKNKKTSIEDLNRKYLCTQKFGVNFENIQILLDNDICSLKQVVDKLGVVDTLGNTHEFCELISNEDLFDYLLEKNIVTSDDLKYLWKNILTYTALDSFVQNSKLFYFVIENDIISFQRIIDDHKNFKQYGYGRPRMQELLIDTELFKYLIENNKLAKEDLKYLLDHISDSDTLETVHLCENALLIKHILNEFVLNKETIEKFNKILNHYESYRRGFFDFLRWTHKNDIEIVKLIDLNEKVCMLSTFDLSKDQKLEVAEVVKNNEVALNKLKEIIDNNLEADFSFDSLMQYLKKTEKKNLLNI